jgi:hypothetical protein
MKRFVLACAAATSCVLAGGCPPLPAVVQSGPCPVALEDPKATSGDETPNKICRADSYNQMIRCQRMQAIVRPRSVGELQSVLRKNKGLHVRALGNRHSITPQYCTDGLGVDVTALRPGDPTQLISHPRQENGKTVVEAWTSLTIHQLSEQLFVHKKSIGFSEIGFRDATVGGVLANGAHGSALDESTLLASRIVGVTLVNAEGELVKYTFDPKTSTLFVQKVIERPGPPTIDGHTLEPARPVALPDALTDAPAPLRPSDVWHALLSNLGMLGIVVRVDVEVEDAFLLWVRLKRLYTDERIDDIDALTAAADVQPRVPPGWQRAGTGCSFFQLLWYPTAAGVFTHTRSGRLFTMCGVKIVRDSVSPTDMARLGAGKMGKNEFIMDDANWSDEQTRTYVNQLFTAQSTTPLPPPAQEAVRQQAQLAALAPLAKGGTPPRTLSGSHVIDADNAVLNPSFSGVFASFKSLGHRYMNAAWPFSRQSAADMYSCKFLEDVRYNGAVIAKSGGGALNRDDFVILGPSHRLISSHLADEGHTITQLDYELAIPERNWKAALAALRARIEHEHLCLPMTGVFIRFSRVDGNTLLTHAAVASDAGDGGRDFRPGERIMFLDFVVYAPIVQDRLNSAEYQREAVYHESYRLAAEMLMRDFGGRPHWGKNASWWTLNQPNWCGKNMFRVHRECSAQAFKSESELPADCAPRICGSEYYLRLLRFEKVIELLDPTGRFENEFAVDAGLTSRARAAGFDGQSARCP